MPERYVFDTAAERAVHLTEEVAPPPPDPSVSRSFDEAGMLEWLKARSPEFVWSSTLSADTRVMVVATDGAVSDPSPLIGSLARGPLGVRGFDSQAVPLVGEGPLSQVWSIAFDMSRSSRTSVAEHLPEVVETMTEGTPVRATSRSGPIGSRRYYGVGPCLLFFGGSP